ncbi:MAG: neutral/alkaline non-lysosomal ceramidase N-terminal domain-containing protein [Opitutaceae bacterium]|nr:neutral/alkaline non-lysosomal ceramidase N-terminal domain-containing protein [Opitutaceae bacterium]
MPEVSSSGFSGLIGVARSDITPPVGIYSQNWGAAREVKASGIHRPLTATGISFRSKNGGSSLVLLSLELGWWRTRKEADDFRKQISEALALQEQALLIHLTHTHAGPVISAQCKEEPGGNLIEEYVSNLVEKCIRLVRQSWEKEEEAVLTWRYGKCGLAKKRDLKNPENPEEWLTGYDPDSSADETLLVGRISNADGTILGTIINYACHPTTLAWDNQLISPDFPGAAREMLEAETGQAPCLYLQGASGELAPAEQYSGDTALADRHGRELGHAALSTLAGMDPPSSKLRFIEKLESGAPLAIWKREESEMSAVLEGRCIPIKFELKGLLTKEEIRQRLEVANDEFERERLRRKMGICSNFSDTEESIESFWVWQLGDSFFVSHPFEAYSHLQQVLRSQFPQNAIAVSNLSNGSLGYLPTTDCYDHDLYSVWQTPFDRGGLEKLMKAEGAVIQELISKVKI